MSIRVRCPVIRSLEGCSDMHNRCSGKCSQLLLFVYAFTGIVLRLIYMRSLALRITVGTIAVVSTSVFNGLVASVY